MTKQINLLLKILQHYVNKLISSVPIPTHFSPPDDTFVVFCHKGIFKKGRYDKGTYYGSYIGNGKTETFEADEVLFWSPRNLVQIPKLDFSNKGVPIKFDLLLDPSSDHVWSYVDPSGKKHSVTYNTYKFMENNPYGTTIESKRKKLEEKSEKAKEQQAKNLSKIKGNSL